MDSMKFVLVGDGAIGKQCFAVRYTSGIFPEGYVPSVFEIFLINVNYNSF